MFVISLNFFQNITFAQESSTVAIELKSREPPDNVSFNDSTAFVDGGNDRIERAYRPNTFKNGIRNVRKQKIVGKSRRWSHRRRLGPVFTPWTDWSKCDIHCKQERERFCLDRRKCGQTRHIEERLCSRAL